MTIDVYIDNNAWDFFFERDFDLNVELPPEEFRILITQEGLFEIQAIPAEKVGKKAYIEETIARRGVETDTFVGFPDPAHGDKQRVGFDEKSRWATEEELEFIKDHKHRVRSNDKQRPSGLYKNEGDLAIAARGYHGVVLTSEGRGNKNPGPLREAYKQGWKIVSLREDFDQSKESLRTLIERASKTSPKPLSDPTRA